MRSAKQAARKVAAATSTSRRVGRVGRRQMSAAGATRRALALFAAVSKTAIVKPASASPSRMAWSSGRRSPSNGSITSLFGVLAAFRRSPQLTSDACGPLHHVGVAFELTADCGSNEIGPVRIETFLHHEVDLPEVDVAEIDRDLFAVSGFWAELMYLLHIAIPQPSTRVVHGWSRINFKGVACGFRPNVVSQNFRTAMSRLARGMAGTLCACPPIPDAATSLPCGRI